MRMSMGPEEDHRKMISMGYVYDVDGNLIQRPGGIPVEVLEIHKEEEIDIGEEAEEEPIPQEKEPKKKKVIIKKKVTIKKGRK